MEALNMVVNAFVVLGVGLVLGYLTRENRADIKELRTELKELRTKIEEGDAQTRAQVREGDAQLRAELVELRSKMEEGDAQIRGEISVLRSDVTLIALAVGAKPRPSTG